ncbi:MAG: hypothetical protein AAB587_00355 [Patescibacteria group bacterium]
MLMLTPFSVRWELEVPLETASDEGRLLLRQSLPPVHPRVNLL